MKGILIVNDAKDSYDILTLIKGYPGLDKKLKEVKIQMSEKVPHLVVGKSKITGKDNILRVLTSGYTRPKPKPVAPRNMDYEDYAYRGIYSEDIKSPIKDIDEDESVQSKKKEIYDEQIRRYNDNLEHKQTPKRIPVEPEDVYVETAEEKTENNLMDYFNRIMNSN